MAFLNQNTELIFEKSFAGRASYRFPKADVPDALPLPDELKRSGKAKLPEVSELELVRHYTNLSTKNFSVDTQFYPLGSCTMKYNPKFTESIASMGGFTAVHPAFSLDKHGEKHIQGSLSVIYELSEWIAEITGMDRVTTHPLAGAHGEMTGIMLIAAYHRNKGNVKKTVIVPDSSHGTNPASAAMVGYDIVTIPTDSEGDMDIELFKKAMNDEVAAVMMTCPNTLGIFNPQIGEICDIAHRYDALMYYDGANLNAIMGLVRPGDVGFDVIHINVHKTFGTPHGGGGPGAGPVGVKKALIPFLPNPIVAKNAEGSYTIALENPLSIGRVSNFFGNFGVLLKAYAYLVALGQEGLIKASEHAVLNANYIMSRLKDYYDLPYDKTCMHECVFSASRQVKNGVHAIDIAKKLIEKGIHPPTVYFPLIVKEAIMIEPTETEDKETLDAFIAEMIDIAKMAESNPKAILDAPNNTPISRPDETKAAREICVRCVD